MDMAVYLNARGINPCMHAAIDATNSFAEVFMQCAQCVAYPMNLNFNLEPASAFVYGNMICDL